MANYLALTIAKDAPLDAPFLTKWIACLGSQYVNVQVANDATGDPIGSWTIEESDDPNADYDTDPANAIATKVDITAHDRVQPIEGDGTVAGAGVWAFEILRPARYFRLIYKPTSGGVGTKCSIYVYGIFNG